MLDALNPARPAVAAAQPPADDPFGGLALSAREGLLTVAPVSPRARFVLRGGEDAAEAAALAMGCALPARVGGAAVFGPVTALKLGPDEWRIAAPLAEGPRLASALAAALAGAPHSLVEVTDRDCGVAVEGPLALEVLSCGCPLDLSTMAAPGATRTVFGQLDALIARTGPESFEVEVWRSYAAHLAEHLRVIARELDCGL